MIKNRNTKYTNAFIKTSLLFALLGTPGFMRAETITVNFSGSQESIGLVATVQGTFTAPDGDLSINLPDLTAVNLQLLDIYAPGPFDPNGQLVRYAFDLASMENFSATIDPSTGDVTVLSLQTFTADPNNIDSSFGIDPNIGLIGTNEFFGEVAGARGDASVTTSLMSGAPEPLSLALCGLGLGMAGLWGMRRRNG